MELRATKTLDVDPGEVARVIVLEVSRLSGSMRDLATTVAPPIIILLCLKVRKDTTYRILLDELVEIPHIRNEIGLSEIPAPSTLCKAFKQLDMAV